MSKKTIHLGERRYTFPWGLYFLCPKVATDLLLCLCLCLLPETTSAKQITASIIRMSIVATITPTVIPATPAGARPLLPGVGGGVKVGPASTVGCGWERVG